MSKYEDPEDDERSEPPKNYFRQPPPYAIGEKVWFTSPSSGHSLEVEFRGWDADIALVRTMNGLIRVHLTSLRKLS